MSSVFRTYKHAFSFRHNTQQSFFLHLRHSQCTQFHFRFSGLKILSWDSRTEKFERSFPDLNFEVATYRKFKKKIKKFQSSKNVQKTFPSVKTCLGAIFLKKFFCSVFHGVIESLRKNQKKFKIAKKPTIVSKIVQICFEHVLRQFFSKKIAPCYMDGRAFQKFQKNQKSFEIQKVPKIVPKVSKRVLNMFGAIISNFFLPRGPCGEFQILWT